MLLAQTDAADNGHTIAQLWQNDANGVPRRIAQLWQADANGNPRLIYSGTTISVNPTQANGYIATRGTSSAYTETVSVSGYSGSPTITWTVPSDWTVISQGASSTAFRSPPIPSGEDVAAPGTVTVAASGVTQSLNFELYASNQGTA